MRFLTTIFALTVVLGLSTAPIGHAQLGTTPPWPDGCSVGLPGWAQQGLDGIFQGACDNHDRCWARCNGASGPFLGLQHRNQCDQTFLAEMSSACAVRATQVLLPLGEIDNVDEFLATCEGVALSFFTAVQTFGTHIYWTSQCLRGCNPMACLQAQLIFPTQDGRPPTCGTFPYTGPGFCYRQPYTPDVCSYHVCPGFFLTSEDDGEAQTSGSGKPSKSKKKSSEGGGDGDLRTDTLMGIECSSILDWYCCPCQYCPSCLM